LSLLFLLDFYNAINKEVRRFLRKRDAILAGFWRGSSPCVDRKRIDQHIDYAIGLEMSTMPYDLKLGRVPYLSWVRFRSVLVDTLPLDFYDADIELELEGPIERRAMAEDTDWYRKTSPSGVDVIFRKSSRLHRSSQYGLILRVSHERSRDYIKARIEENINERNEDGKTIVIVTIRNNWKFEVRNYEIAHTVPTLEGLHPLYVQSPGGRKDSLSPYDCAVRFDISFAKIEEAKEKKVGERQSYLVIVSVNLAPGLTEVAFEYGRGRESSLNVLLS